MSEDLIGFSSGDKNFYRYVKNSPINYSDPMGRGILTCFMVSATYLADLDNITQNRDRGYASIRKQIADIEAKKARYNNLNLCKDQSVLDAFEDQIDSLNNTKAQITKYADDAYYLTYVEFILMYGACSLIPI